MTNRRANVKEDMKDEIRGQRFVDLDRLYTVLFEGKVDNDGQVNTFEQWEKCYNLMVVAMSLLALELGISASDLEDRLSYPAFLKGQRKVYSDKSLLEYDRALRYSRQGWVKWGGSLDDVLRISLVPRASADKESYSKKRGLDEGSDKKKKKKKVAKKAKCNKTSDGEVCTYGAKCKFSHICPNCKKSEPHVWKDCA
jgi:hypothetical protein